MALYDGTDVITGTKSATVFNQMASSKFIDQVKKTSPLIDMALGNPVVGLDGVKGFEKLEDVSGDRVEFSTRGGYRTVQGLADGAAERATITANPLVLGANVKADIAHYNYTLVIEDSLLKRVSGKRMKISSFYEEVFSLVRDSFRDKYALDINATGAGVGPSTSRLGSWVALVSDGTTAGETNYTDFYGISRSAAGNDPYKSIVTGSVAQLTLAKIALAQEQVMANTGNPTIGIANATVYGIIRGLCEGRTDATVSDSGLVSFSGPRVRYAGTEFALEAKAPAQTLGLLDPSSWFARRNDMPLTSTGIMPWLGLAAAYGMRVDQYFGIFCNNPSNNAKLTGITS